MNELFFQSFCMIGLCFILKYGSILNWPRNFLIKFKFFEQLFDCSLCLGFWVGLFFGIVWLGSAWLWCFYSSGVCFFADLVMLSLKKKIWG